MTIQGALILIASLVAASGSGTEPYASARRRDLFRNSQPDVGHLVRTGESWTKRQHVTTRQRLTGSGN